MGKPEFIKSDPAYTILFPLLQEEGFSVRLLMSHAQDMFHEQTGFSNESEDSRFAFHESGHVISNGVDASPRSEGRGIAAQSVISRGLKRSGDYNPRNIDLSHEMPRPYPSFDEVVKTVRLTMPSANEYWSSQSDPEGDALIKGFHKLQTLWSRALRKEAPAPLNLEPVQTFKPEDTEISDEEIHDVYLQTIHSDQLFMHITGGAPYQFSAAEYRKMPLIFMGIEEVQNADGSCSYEPISDERYARLMTIAKTIFPLRAAKVATFNKLNQPAEIAATLEHGLA